MSSSSSLNRLELGKEAEAVARDYLTNQGLKVILENFRCRTGELDIVALHEKTLVVVEVRMRTHSNYVDAAASVDSRKRARIIAATRYLLLNRPQLSRYPVRFDVVALDRTLPQNHSRLAWIRNAFEAPGG